MTPQSIREELCRLAEPSLRDFSSALIPGCRNLLGVRLPRLREIARRIARDDWRSYLDHNPLEYFEERMLQGMVIGYARCPVEERLQRAAAFIPQIDNWSICDSFCTGFRIAPAEREAVWRFIDTLLASNREFTLRTGVVLLLAHYIDYAHIDAVLDRLEALRHEGYYCRMAVAWALSVCYVKFPERTLPRLERSPLDDWTYNKTLQKIVESLRVDAAAKARIRAMKRPSPRGQQPAPASAGTPKPGRKPGRNSGKASRTVKTTNETEN